MKETFWCYLKGAAKGVTFGACLGALIFGIVVLGVLIFNWAVASMPAFVALAVVSVIAAIALIFGIAVSLMIADWVLK